MTGMLVAAAALLFVGFLAGRYRGVYQLQNEGEAAVSKAIIESLPAPTYHLMNNLTLPIGNGTTQVDHVLVSKFGIFVVETKSYKGWIFADPKSPVWTQVLFKRKYKFQNPIHQNYKHVKSIQALLDFLPPNFVHPVVVFTGGAEFRTPRPEGVFTIESLIAYLQNFSNEVMSENRMQFCVGRLECCRLALTRQTDVEHRTYLKRMFGDTT